MGDPNTIHASRMAVMQGSARNADALHEAARRRARLAREQQERPAAVRQVVDLRYPDPARASAFANPQQRDQYLRQHEAFRKALPPHVQFAVALGGGVRVADGSMRSQGMPIARPDLAGSKIEQAREWERLLVDGTVIENYGYRPSTPPEAP